MTLVSQENIHYLFLTQIPVIKTVSGYIVRETVFIHLELLFGRPERVIQHKQAYAAEAQV